MTKTKSLLIAVFAIAIGGAIASTVYAKPKFTDAWTSPSCEIGTLPATCNTSGMYTCVVSSVTYYQNNNCLTAFRKNSP